MILKKLPLLKNSHKSKGTFAGAKSLLWNKTLAVINLSKNIDKNILC